VEPERGRSLNKKESIMIKETYLDSEIVYNEFRNLWIVDDENFSFEKSSLKELKESMDNKVARDSREKKKKKKFERVSIYTVTGNSIEKVYITSISNDTRGHLCAWVTRENGDRSREYEWFFKGTFLDTPENLEKWKKMCELQKQRDEIEKTLDRFVLK
jgi:hypothetical protein